VAPDTFVHFITQVYPLLSVQEFVQLPKDAILSVLFEASFPASFK
jgi:hypothetical protein